MPTFTYEGQDQSGAAVSDTVEAADRFEVYEIARKAGHTVDSISENSGLRLKKLFNVEKIEYLISRVKTDELVMVTKNLGSMLTAGLPLSRCLSVIERQSTNPRLKGVFKAIIADINAGSQLHEAMYKYPKVFDNLFIAMIKAGEESGGLAESLRVLGIQMERSSSLKKRIKGAMIYPAIVITVLVLIGILMMMYVMPSITETFESLDVELPATTQTLITISNALNDHTVLVLGGLLTLIIGFVYSLRTTMGKTVASWVVIRLPVIGTMAKETNSARTARTLSSLLSSGVDVIRAINITEEVVQNVYYKRVLADTAARVEKGTALSESFVERTDLYPVLVGEMILVGEETGKISGMLEQLAEFYESEVEQKTQNLSAVIEPLLMVVIGGTVGFFALAMIAPIYSISDSF